MALLNEKTIFRLLIATLIIGTLYRLYPIMAGQPALAQFFITEDGYLMLTIARNMAIGLGMSVSEGTVSSNGVQPLATFIFALPYWLTEGDKVVSLIWIQLISVVISVAGIFSVRALARDVLKVQDDAPLWPWMVASLWFIGPLLLLHTMNGLETGLYTVMVTVTLVMFGRLLAEDSASTLKDRLWFGAICGVTFLARNDAVFLLTAIFAVWAMHGLFVRRQAFLSVVTDLLWPGLLSIVVSAPWLINNQINFGSIVPISGTAQSHSASFGQNAGLLPAKLFELMFPMLPVPESLENSFAFAAVVLSVVIGISLYFIVRLWRRGGAMRYVMLAYGLFALAQCFYYGFEFGAPWFLSRYLSPLAPFFIIALMSVLLDFLSRLMPRRGMATLSIFALLSIVLSLVLLGRFFIPGVRAQGHFQVVDWVAQNVPSDAWVGAVQTGTVGYWHDRTVNLDGKVNPAALRALLDEGNVLNYVLGSKIEYVADWSGVADWAGSGNMGNTAFSDSFDVVVQNGALNLGVLKRH